eukprot:41616-Pyramimonas_sp.AAC.1
MPRKRPPDAEKDRKPTSMANLRESALVLQLYLPTSSAPSAATACPPREAAESSGRATPPSPKFAARGAQAAARFPPFARLSRARARKRR